MQMEIFNANASSEVDLLENEHDTLPSFVGTLQQLYDGFDTALKQYRDALSELSALEQSAYSPMKYTSIIKALSEVKLNELRYDKAIYLRSRLIQHAVDEFSDPRTQLVIDSSVVDAVSPFKCGKPIRFSAALMWRHLRTLYQGDKGIHESWKQVAMKINQCFSLERNNEIKRVKGHVIINLRLGHGYRFGDGRTQLCSAWREYADTLQALSLFAEWANADQLLTDMRAELNKANFDYTYMPKDKVYLGADNELVITTFLNRFEFRFAQALASQLQLFIGTYSQSLNSK